MSHPNENDLALWAGGDLPAGEAARVAEHLEACPDCRGLAEGLRASRAAVEALAAEPIDDTALARVRRGLRLRLAEEEARAARRRRSAAVYLAGALAAALAAAAVGLGIWYGLSSPADEETVARAERPEPAAPERRAVAPPAESPETVPRRERPETRPAPEEDSREPRIASREPRTAPQRSETRRPASAAPAPPTLPTPDPPQQRADLAPNPAGPTESMVIKVVSDDPNIVYYWLVEPEETEDETVTS